MLAIYFYLPYNFHRACPKYYMKQRDQAIALKDCLKAASVNEVGNNSKHFTKLLHQLQKYYVELDRQHNTELNEFKKELEIVEQEYQTTAHEAIETLQSQLDAYEKEIELLKIQNKKLFNLNHVNELKTKELEGDKLILESKNEKLKKLVKGYLKYCEEYEIPRPDEKNMLSKSQGIDALNSEDQCSHENQENVLK
eukprot:NODE_226_length_13883_cov_0.528729.p8 type:complete len:196 gc:universal NODE_226_length_13883_cov_0.528729:13707-13120(-)